MRITWLCVCILIATHETESVRDRQNKGSKNIPRSFQHSLELKQNKHKLGSPNITREMTLLDRGHDFTLYDLRQVDQDLTSKEHARISAIRNFFLVSENQFN